MWEIIYFMQLRPPDLRSAGRAPPPEGAGGGASEGDAFMLADGQEGWQTEGRGLPIPACGRRALTPTWGCARRQVVAVCVTLRANWWCACADAVASARQVGLFGRTTPPTFKSLPCARRSMLVCVGAFSLAGFVSRASERAHSLAALFRALLPSLARAL